MTLELAEDPLLDAIERAEDLDALAAAAEAVRAANLGTTQRGDQLRAAYRARRAQLSEVSSA